MFIRIFFTNSELNSEHERVLKSINERAADVKRKLRTMDAQIKDLNTDVITQTDLRICETQYTCLASKSVDFLTRLNDNQFHYRAVCKERILRQLSIAGKVFDDETIDDIVDRGTFATVFQREVLSHLQAILVLESKKVHFLRRFST